MLSRALADNMMRRGLSKILQNQQRHGKLQNAIFARGSGHNTMMIKPSSSIWLQWKNWTHFYLLVVGIPVGIAVTIINIRANPQLIDIPDGYEPRHWEYFKHPITRWMAKYMFYPVELDYEAIMGIHEYNSELLLLRRAIEQVDTVMRFYNDHRTTGFLPGFGADYMRKQKDIYSYKYPLVNAFPGSTLEDAYDPDVAILATEGFKDGPTEGM